MKINKNKFLIPFKSIANSQLGATMPFLITSVITLVLIAGLLINIGINALKIEDSRSLVRTAALVAVKEFFKTRKHTANLTTSLNTVVTGLDELVSNSNTSLNSERFKDLKISFQAGGPNNTSLSQTNPTSSFGVVTPGLYDQTTGAFTAVDITGPSPVLNAIKVDMMLGSDSIYNKFARSFLGGGSGFKRSSAIGVFQPSSIYFLVDISGSAVSQSHIRRNIRHQESGAPRGGLLSVRCSTPDPLDPNYINSYIMDPSASNSAKNTNYRDPDYCSPVYRPGQHGPAVAGSAGSAVAETDPITGVVTRYYSTLATDDYCLSPTARVSTSNYCQWKFIRDYHAGSVTDNGYYLNQDGTTTLPAGYHYRMGDDGVGSATSHYDNNFVDVNVAPTGLDPHVHPLIGDNADQSGNLKFKDFGGRFMIDKEALIQGNAQPLSDILKAINGAIGELNSRGIPGDSAGVMFFERFPYVSRTFKLSKSLSLLGNEIAVSFPDTSGNSAQRLIDLGIFPSDEQFTDLGMGLEVAFKQIMDSEMRQLGLKGNDQVIYIGDGLTNCTPFPNPELDADGDGMFDHDDLLGMSNCCWTSPPNNCLLPQGSSNAACSKFPNPASVAALYANNPISASGCTDTYSQYDSSLDVVRGILSSKYAAEDIKFNVIHIGKNAGAHTVGQPSGTSSCNTSPKDLEKGGFIPVKPIDSSDLTAGGFASINKAYAGQSTSNPFFQAAYDMYTLTSTTGGLYNPVLEYDSNCTPTCDGNTRITCSNSSQQSQLSQIMSDLIKDPDPFRLYDSD